MTPFRTGCLLLGLCVAAGTTTAEAAVDSDQIYAGASLGGAAALDYTQASQLKLQQVVGVRLSEEASGLYVQGELSESIGARRFGFQVTPRVGYGLSLVDARSLVLVAAPNLGMGLALQRVWRSPSPHPSIFTSGSTTTGASWCARSASTCSGRTVGLGPTCSSVLQNASDNAAREAHQVRLPYHGEAQRQVTRPGAAIRFRMTTTSPRRLPVHPTLGSVEELVERVLLLVQPPSSPSSGSTTRCSGTCTASRRPSGWRPLFLGRAQQSQEGLTIQRAMGRPPR